MEYYLQFEMIHDGVPLNYVYNKGNIYFHCAVEGNKWTTSCLIIGFRSVIGNTEPIPDKFSYRYESVLVFGRYIHDGEKEDALIALIRKYSSGFMEKGMEYIKKDCHNVKVIKICIEHLTGKARK